MIQYIPALIVGFVFGWLLQKAGLTKYSKIVNVFRFTDMAVLKFMMSALVVGMIGIYFLKDLGLVTARRHACPPTSSATWWVA